MLRGISVITSLGCNLNCEYCRIEQAKQNNKNTAHLQTENIQALKDGTFLKNIKQVLYNIGESPITIWDLAFWGQEPTLTLNYITDNLEDWVEVFPNWKKTMFSTNGVANGEKIVNFIKRLEDLMSHDFFLDLQVSYDGDESTENLRKANSEKIINTVKFILNELNKTHLNKVKVRIFLHGVISLELLDRLDSFKKIYDYNKNIQLVVEELNKINLNKNVEFVPGIGIGLEVPVDATTEYGLKLYNFVKQTNKITDKALFSPYDFGIQSLVRSYYNYITNVVQQLIEQLKLKNILELIEIINTAEDYNTFNIINKKLSSSLWCGNAYSEIKIMYDGTLINCQNHIFDRNIEDLPTDDSIESSVKRGLATHNYYINPLKDNLENIRQYFSIFKDMKETGFIFMFKNTINLMYWLLQSKQIDESYNDIEKLLRHGFYLTAFNSCSYNNLVKTGTTYVRSTGYIRFYCNGMMDCIEQIYLTENGRGI